MAVSDTYVAHGIGDGKGAPSPTVSILVPCFNVERYLKACLDSIAGQTLTCFEVICINDGSTDATLDIIRSYAEHDSRFVVVDKPNSGYGASMNRGLDIARGEFIAILESDDFMEPQALATLVDAARKHHAQATKANFYFYWGTPEPHNQKNELIHASDPDVVDPKTFPKLFWYMPSIWSAVYRRDYLEERGIRFLETPGASYQDLAFTFKVWAGAERVALVKDAFVHYRQDNEASSIHAAGKVFCVCDEFAEIERWIDAHPEQRGLKPVEVRLKFDSYIWNYKRLDPALRRQFLPRLHEEFKREEASGTIAYDLYLPWYEVDLRHILKNPDDFAVWFERTGGKQGRIANVLRFWRMGGIPLVRKWLAWRKTI